MELAEVAPVAAGGRSPCMSCRPARSPAVGLSLSSGRFEAVPCAVRGRREPANPLVSASALDPLGVVNRLIGQNHDGTDGVLRPSKHSVRRGPVRGPTVCIQVHYGDGGRWHARADELLAGAGRGGGVRCRSDLRVQRGRGDDEGSHRLHVLPHHPGQGEEDHLPERRRRLRVRWGPLGSGFCNWRIDFTYADTDNRTYRTSRGATHAQCKIDPMRNNSPQTLPRYGKACAHPHVNGVRRVSQCHHITK